LRIEHWQKVQQIDPQNLVFLDEMGVLLGLTRTHARSPYGSRVYDFKPFYRGSKVTVIGAIVVMDNLPAHKVKEIEPLIESVGASILYQSPYSPDFNPIEHWWSQLKAFLRQFSASTPKMVDVLIATALDLMNPQHLKNWFTHCCYCTS